MVITTNTFYTKQLKSGGIRPITKKVSKTVTKSVSAGAPARASSKGKEVFHISNNDYTFEQAACKCKSYGADLATYEQVVDAYNRGANWCSYGWSKGQQALFPIQQEYYDELQKGPASQRDDCGKPGVNGGYFQDPNLKFGINCYGPKPTGTVIRQKQPRPEDKCTAFPDAVKSDMDKVLPFNPNRWHMVR